ncbi:MAG: SRPBCC family protein [Solirubrobacteraceae bacterium]
MSAVVEVSIDISASPEQVWEVIMDPGRLGDWVTIHRKLGEVSHRPLEDGSQLEQTLCVRGVSFKVKWEVTEHHEPRMARWEGRGPVRSHASTEYRLAENGDGGTHLDYRNEFKAPLGPLGSVASRAVVGGVPEREANSSLRKLKALVERE